MTFFRCANKIFNRECKSVEQSVKRGDSITSLTCSNYYKGPKQDFSRPGEIWEFKKKIGNTVFYIKLKIDLEGNRKVLKCLGFHEDEFAM